MKKVAVAFLFCFASTIVNAQFNAQKPVICSDFQTVIEFLFSNQIKEQPAWSGKENHSKIILAVNEDNKTLLQTDGTTACVIGTGDESKFMIVGKPVKLSK